VVTSNTTLMSDCEGPLVIGVANVRVNLNRHAVVCEGPHNGIVIEAPNVRVVNGSVRGCQVGVLSWMGAGNGRITRVWADDNFTGFALLTPGNLVAFSRATNNFAGFSVENGSHNWLLSNHASANSQFDIDLLSTTGNVVVGNRVFGEADIGIRAGDDATSNTIALNIALFHDEDLFDITLGCDNNVWLGNIFFIANQDCIH
jgi:hypothetical protein